MTDVQLSPDGRELLFVTRRADPVKDRFEQKLWHMQLELGATPRVLAAGEGERAPGWAPDGHRITWISTRGGSPQIWVLDPGEEGPRQLTSHPTGVQQYAWSPDGQRLAFTAMGDLADFEFEAAAGKDRKHGIVVDKTTFVIYRLLGKATFRERQRRTDLFVVHVEPHATEPALGERVNREYFVENYAWSPDGRAIAFTGRPTVARTPRADLVLYSFENGALRTLKEGRTGPKGTYDWHGGIAYSRPFWSPDGTRIGFVRQSDGFPTRDEVGIYTLATGEIRFVPVDASHDFYLPRFSWLRDAEIVVEDVWQGRGSLLSIRLGDARISPLVHSAQYMDSFSFSTSGERAAWVQEALDQPPEIFVGERPFAKGWKVTALNDRMTSLSLPKAKPIRWRSSDGVRVEGWLMKPLHYKKGRRYPLLVVVHGGPAVPVANEFMPYPYWPYPVQSFSSRGYAVLLPNYRGTGSYDKEFRRPPVRDREPVEDLIAGIEHLIEVGVADRERVGIMGHSHGSWLGPMTVIRHPTMFKAASFAEGAVNYISLYGHMSGWLTVNLHEKNHGNPYENVARYIEISPIFHLKGTSTATLLEFGQESLATQGMEFAAALWRNGIPHELVVYPGTGHNISSAALLLESAERNLDWFDFWMLRKKDAAPEKREQYRRWERMREGYSVYEPLR